MLGLSKRNIIINIHRTVLVLVLLFTFGIIGSQQVGAQPVDNSSNGSNQTPATGQEDTSGGTEDTTEQDEITCAIEKVGWIVCPLIDASGKVGDQAFSFLAKTFLETEPELVAAPGNTNASAGTYNAWELARNLANIMFVIAFLIIIYSQVTGAGITNYGIKKMLPRLIIAAIAVNVSFYICQILVDLTNVLGYEVQNFLVNTAKAVSDRAAMPPAGTLVSAEQNGTLETIFTAVLGSPIVWILLPFLFLGAGTIVLTCLILIVILLLRKAFIVLLIVISPVAFVMYLLPNTEKLFSKWLSMFWKLLLVFPIIGLLMGGGQLASAIILVAGSTGETGPYAVEGQCIQLPSYGSQATSGRGGAGQSIGDQEGSDAQDAFLDGSSSATIGECGASSTSLLLGIVAAVIAVAPLVAVFAVLKGALAGAGALGGKIAGAVDTYARKGGEWGTKNTAIGRGMAARQALKQNYKNAKFTRRMTASGARGAMTRTAARGVMGNVGMVAGAAGTGIGNLGSKLPGGNLTTKAGSLGASAINGMTRGIQAQNSGLTAHFAAAASKEEKDSKDAEHVIVDAMPPDEMTKQADQLISGGDFNSPRLAALLEQIAKIDQATFMSLSSKVTEKPVKGGTVVSRAIAGSMSNTGTFGGGDVAQVANGQAAMNLTATSISNLTSNGVSSTDLAKMSKDQLEHIDKLTIGNTQARAHINQAYDKMSADQKGNMNAGKHDVLRRF